ncbi:hypothetical protein TL16_g02858 [Triparma laevis f. inornata]|uniref:Uncharacterized protein n=1 Tax=Triparma laevis f. inornata TaxID=1714386 RepID=A0A9W7DYL2_9STRA|nr:hypothetical protein TL16_g02858 [Triparma laevis f. inornata]
MTRRVFLFTPLLLATLSTSLELYSRLNLFSPPSLLLSTNNKVYRWFASLRNAQNLPPIPPIPTSSKLTTIVFHGAGGEDSFTNELMQRLKKDNQDYNHIYNWSNYSTNLFKAAFNAQAIGSHVASEILKSEVDNIHIIGISVGSFAADSCCKRIKSLGENKNVQLTLLDPFTQRGVFGVGWGVREFGKSADYSQQFFNTDDPVPSTNEPLQNCAVFDVTQAKERQGEDKDIFGHDWPLVYFARYWGDTGVVEEGRRIKRGEVINVP